MAPQVISIALPEYRIDREPDALAIGRKIDAALLEGFAGRAVALRAISLAEHAPLTLDELAGRILACGTDRYDPGRLPVDDDPYAPYRLDMHASASTIGVDHFGEGEDFVRKFYENILLDRGYRLRIDLFLVYDLAQLVRAEKSDPAAPGVPARLEPYLWRFRDPARKRDALLGLVKLLP